MTIKQQGGIFGRNPSFNDLEANTAYVVDELGVGESNPARVVHIKASVPAIRLEDSDIAGLYHEFLATAGGQFQFKADGGNVQASSSIAMVVDGANVGTFGSTGLAFLSGQGIDFSATSGTGTSELFDDYEEGTWTPVVSSLAGTITTVGTVVGTYTKVGRVVNLFWQVIISDNGTGASAIVVSGIPFNASSAFGVYAGCGYRNNTGVGLVQALAATSGPIYVRAADGTYPALSGEILYGSIVYEV